MAGRKPWRCTAEDQEYVCQWILKTFGEDERRADLDELNNIIDSFLPHDIESLKNALRQHRRRQRLNSDLFSKPKTVELQAAVYEALKGYKKAGESFSDSVARLLENVTQ